MVIGTLAQLLPLCLEVTGEMTAGDLLVGVGTLLLAAFTFRLAQRTSREVTLTEEALALNRESIEALDRPFVIATPDGNHHLLGFKELGSEHPGWRFVFRLWNMGKGPAIVEHMSLVESFRHHEYLTGDESMERAVAMDPPVFDGLSRLVGNAPPGPNADLVLRIHYRSASGVGYVTTSKVHVTNDLSCICTDFRREERPDSLRRAFRSR